MKLANCPQCGAQVTFHAAASVLAVCEYCTSTLMRRGEALEHIGKMAELQDDPTLIQIATEGTYKGVHFGVIGRIQMRYAAGLWNEWHIMFDDMRTGWLGEASGEFYVTFERQVALAPPPFEALKVDDRIDLGGRFYTVTNLESATCITGQGELPFSVGPGYAAPVADLELDGEFATIDYSDTGEGITRVYVGEKVSARDLKFGNLRDPRDAPDVLAPKHQADAFNCPNCAAPFKLSSGKIQTYGCASCGAVLDTSDKRVQLVEKAQAAMAYPLRIALGSKGRFSGEQFKGGKLEGVEWELIGHMRRSSDAGFSWSEYLLFNVSSGYAWLSESDGHWSVSSPPERTPKVIGLTAFHRGESFDHYQHYQTEVQHVLGEFYWKVKAGDLVDVNDYILPPQLLSREKTANEVSWSCAQYLTPEQVRLAFNVKTPLAEPKGIAPNQPSPFTQTNPVLWKRFGLFALGALLLQVYFAFTTNTVMKDTFSIAPNIESTKTTEPFKIAGNGPLVLQNRTDVDNNWASFNYTLVDPGTGKVWRAEQNVEHYSGVDQGESWSEGSRSAQVVFADVPPGTYQLQVEGETAKNARHAVGATLQLERGHASWLNWLLLQVLLLLMPLWGWWRAKAFENARWADSDHPRDNSDDDDDDTPVVHGSSNTSSSSFSGDSNSGATQFTEIDNSSDSGGSSDSGSSSSSDDN